MDEAAVYLTTGNPLPSDIESVVDWLLNEPFVAAFQSECLWWWWWWVVVVEVAAVAGVAAGAVATACDSRLLAPEGPQHRQEEGEGQVLSVVLRFGS